MDSQAWLECLEDTMDGSVSFDIHTAASIGDLEVVKHYLERDPTLSCDSRTGDLFGWCPLLRAAWYGHADVTAALCSAARQIGLDPGAVAAPNCGRTALMAAALHGYEDVVVILAEGSAVMERDKKGRTALHHAVFSGNDRVVRILLNAGADPAARDVDGNTAKILAELRGRTCIAKVLSLAAPSLPPTPLLNADAQGGRALRSLLAGLKLEKYWPIFEAQGIGLQRFLQMDEEGLRVAGITLELKRKQYCYLSSTRKLEILAAGKLAGENLQHLLMENSSREQHCARLAFWSEEKDVS